MCLLMSQAILIEHELYFYIQRGSSEMHSGVTKLFVDRINSAYMCLESIPIDKTYFRGLRLRYLYSMMFYIRHSSRNSELYAVAKANCKNAYQKTRSELISNPFIGWGRKMYLLFNYHFPSIYSAIQNVIKIIRR